LSILNTPIATAKYVAAVPQMSELLLKQWPGLPDVSAELFEDHGALETSLIQYVTAQLAEYTPAHQVATVLSHKGHKWRAMSALQKAIRRSDTLLAYKAGRAMLFGGVSSDLWRRLAVISLEDIGLADPYQSAFASLFAGNKALRLKLGEEKLMFWLLDKMCGAAKSRDLCDLIFSAWCDPPCKAVEPGVRALSTAEVLEVACDDGAPLMERLWAYRHMWDRWKDKKEEAHPAGLKKEFYDRIKLPSLFQYIAMQNIRATNESLAICIPVTWQLMLSSEWAEAGPDPFEGYEGALDKIGAVYAATYDKHTQEGKAAAKTFLNSSPELIQAANDLCLGQGLASVERAIFYVEGALLLPRFGFAGAKTIFDDVLDSKFKTTGFKTFEDGMEFFHMVGHRLPHLNQIRKNIVGGP